MKTIFSKPAEPEFGGRALKVVRHASARVMRLRVDPRDGAVRLTIPRRASLRRAFAWVEEQRAWVEAQLERAAEPVRLVPGTVLEVFGERMTLRGGEIDSPPRLRGGAGGGSSSWVLESEKKDHPRPLQQGLEGSGLRSVRRVSDQLLVSGDPALFEARVLRWLKREALRVLTDETRALADRAGVTVGRISIGDPRSRWGSCSAAGDIRYSWRLILAPAFVLRSTVAHEVAHRVHMNHGPRFKALEQELLGESPAAARAWLRAHGAGLYRVGLQPPPTSPRT